MIEPITLSVPELAARWKQTPRQILEHAVTLQLPAYFHFHGLVFDFNDRRLRFGGDSEEREGSARLQREIENAETQLARHTMSRSGLLKLSVWEQKLSDNDVAKLRSDVTDKKRMLAQLETVLEHREEARVQCARNGLLRAAPATLQALAERGRVAFPRFAYHPEKPTWLKAAPDGNGQMLEGHILALEDARHSKGKLTIDDVLFSLADVKKSELMEAAPVEVGKSSEARRLAAEVPAITSVLIGRENDVHIIPILRDAARRFLWCAPELGRKWEQDAYVTAHINDELRTIWYRCAQCRDEQEIYTACENVVAEIWRRTEKGEEVPATYEIAARPGSTRSTGPSHQHKVAARSQPVLTAEIKVAKGNAVDPDDATSVWAELVKLAEVKFGCLIGADEDAIKYQDGESVLIFKKRSLRERMRRELARRDA